MIQKKWQFSVSVFQICGAEKQKRCFSAFRLDSRGSMSRPEKSVYIINIFQLHKKINRKLFCGLLFETGVRRWGLNWCYSPEWSARSYSNMEKNKMCVLESDASSPGYLCTQQITNYTTKGLFQHIKWFQTAYRTKSMCQHVCVLVCSEHSVQVFSHLPSRIDAHILLNTY